MSSSTVNSNSSSSSCAQLQFTVQDSERPGLLREYETIRRIEKLFSVHLIFGLPPSHQEQQGEWVILKLTGCEEDNFKAKRYITALCMPETKLMVNSGGTMFTDILSRDSSGSVCDELEHKYQVTISPSPNGASVLVKGAQSDVYRVAERLSMDASTNGDRLPCTIPRGGEVRNSEPSHSHNFQSISYMSPNTDPNSTPCSQDLEQQLCNALQKGVGNFPDHLKKALLEQLVGQNDTERHLPGQNAHPMHNSAVIPRAADQAREQRIENFTRLDYPRQKVEAVLDSLGVSAADDAILARLVRVCQSVRLSHATLSTNHQKVKSLNTSRPRSRCGEPIMSVVVPSVVDPSQLRHIVIDGSNVAMSHGNGRVFSCRGIQLAVDFFKERGHVNITVFVPEWRKETSRPETPITDQEILYSLERENVLTFTPSRRVKGKRIVCYDDRFIVRLAHNESGVILSNDQFRDLIDEKPVWRDVIEQRLIQFRFVNDLLMIPDDPLGRHGPTLDQLLLKDEVSAGGTRRPGMDKASNLKICPYLETGCTFGRKCKFYHPDREQPSTSTGNKTPNSSRSATPSPSPEKSLAYKQSNEDLKPHYSGYVDDLKPSSGEIHPASSYPTIDISTVSDVLGQMSLQNSPHKHSSESAQSYPTPFSQQQQQQQQLQQPTYMSKPNYIGLSPPQPQDYSRSSPALTSEPLCSTPLDDTRPHMHTFPMATLHQSHNTRQYKVATEDLTKHRQPTAAFGAPLLQPETTDPSPRMQLPMDQQYNMPPASHLLPRGLDPRIPPYPPELYPQQYGGTPAQVFSPPYHPSQPGTSYPKRPMSNTIQRGAHGMQQPNKSISYPFFEPHHQGTGHLGGRRSVDYGTLSSQSFAYHGDGYQHLHRHQRRLTGDPIQMRTTAPSYNMPSQSQSSGGHSLAHSHSLTQLPTQYSSRLSEAAAYYPPTVSSNGMRYVPQQHQQQFQPNQSEFEPIFDEGLFHNFVAVFPGCEERIRRVMLAYPSVTDCAEFQILLNQMN